MAGRSKFSDADRAKVYTSLQINDGNIKRTARETGMAIGTVRDWKQKWDTDGVPDEVIAATTVAVDEFIEHGTQVRNLLLHRMEELAPEVKNIREAATAFGILDDKIVRAKGLPTSRTEHLQPGLLPSPAEVRALMGGWLAGSLAAQAERERDIIEVTAEVVEPSRPELDPAPTAK